MTTTPPSFREFELELPELIALDIDDTLIPHLGAVSDRVIDAIAAAKAAGITVVVATGRSLSTAAPVARTAGIDGWAICSNGAITGTVEPEGIVESRAFDPRPILEFIAPQLPGARYAVEDVHGTFHTMSTGDFDAGILGLQIREVTYEHLLDEPAVRVVVHSDAEDHLNEGFGGVARQLGLHTVIFGVGDRAWMDIGPQGVNKATGVAELCKHLDINPARTIAMGDGDNDVEMLEWAGLGIAMGHAPERVLRRADAVTASEPGVGVAEVIEHLLG